MADRPVIRGGHTSTSKKKGFSKSLKGFDRRLKDSDKDGVPDRHDCRPFNPKKQGAIHDAYVKLRTAIKDKRLENEHKAIRMREKRETLKKFDNFQALREAEVKHRIDVAKREKKIKEMESKARKMEQELHPTFLQKAQKKLQDPKTKRRLRKTKSFLFPK